MKFPQLLYYRERDTQRRKEANSILFIYLFVAKIRQKVPHENIYGEGNFLENSPPKKKSPHFEEEKNRF
jgi:hypothetical protein